MHVKRKKRAACHVSSSRKKNTHAVCVAKREQKIEKASGMEKENKWQITCESAHLGNEAEEEARDLP
jgi:hypothetical protein